MNKLVIKVLKSSENTSIHFGIDEAINIRTLGWEEVENENLVLIAPEATLNKALPKSVKSRGKAKQNKVAMKFIENIDSLASLEKNLKRIEQGIEVRYYKHSGFSLTIRDNKTVILELPYLENELMNIRIDDKDLANNFRNYYFTIWEKAKPLEEKLIKQLKETLK